MKKFYLSIFLLFSIAATAQNKQERIVLKLLDDQTKAWNTGNIEGFMKGYWKNDSLMFIGKSGVVWGWQQTLDNYKKGYPDTAAMGKLNFDIIQVKQLTRKYMQVVGKWMLTRAAGNLSGHYTLLLKKIKGEWVIISDHSS